MMPVKRLIPNLLLCEYNLAGEWDVYLVIVTFLGSAAAISAVIFSIRYDKKNLQLQGLMLIYDKLNNPEASDARKLVYETYHKRLIEQGLKSEFTPDNFANHPVIDIAKDDGQIRHAVERVRSDFEQISVMEHNGLLNEAAYFDAYWGTALRVYGAIHGHIEAIRKESGTKHYSVYFEQQSERMKAYWKQYHPDSKIIYYGGDHSFYD